MRTHNHFLLCAVCLSVAVLAGEPAGKDELALDTGSNTKLELVRINPGTFEMGSPRSEDNRDPYEKPHRVTISVTVHAVYANSVFIYFSPAKRTMV